MEGRRKRAKVKKETLLFLSPSCVGGITSSVKLLVIKRI